MDKILEVKNLKISFRTNGGTVKAVRDISFDLERGKTLAIVGESGSGKSVTSKAILGILAGNSIIEGGEILYDGKDLLKIGEDDMYKIRGDKVSMIFQDPLSSLNPIVKIGKQITEAMLLKNKTGRAEAKKEFNALLARRDQEEMLLMLRCIYARRRSLKKAGKHLPGMDDDIMHSCEKLLTQEFSLCLQIPPEEVGEYLHNALDGDPC